MAPNEKTRLLVTADVKINHVVRMIGSAPGNIVVLDVPKAVPVLESVANLKLLQFYAERAAKTLRVHTELLELRQRLAELGIETEETEAALESSVKESKHARGFRPRWYHLAVIPLLVTCLAYLAYYSPEPARITVIPETTPFETQVVVPLTDLQTISLTTTFTVADEFASSGRSVEPITAACGSVILINDTGQAVKVPKGTVVATTGDLRYKTLSPVTVPARATEYFHEIPVGVRAGQVEVRVEAAVGGSTGNIAANRIVSMPDFPALKVVNPEPFSGGQDRTMAVVTEQDLATLRTRLQDLATDRVQQELRLATAPDQLLLPPTVKWELTQVQAGPPVGEKAGVVQGKAMVSAEAAVLSDALITEQAVEVILEQLAVDGVKVDLGQTTVQVAEIREDGLVCQVAASLTTALSSAELIRLVAGQKVDEAALLLQERQGVRAVEIDAGQRQRLPRHPHYIQLVIGAEPSMVPASGQ